MQQFITSNQWYIRLFLAGLAISLGLGAASYIVHRYSVKGAPSFRREYDLVLKNYEGADVRLASFKNRVLIVTAWASWCPYCKTEIEHLAAATESFKGDVQVVGINRAESLADAKVFSDALVGAAGVQFFLDPNDSFYKEMGGYAMPETLFIDPYGHVLFHQRGPMAEELVRQKVADLLK